MSERSYSKGSECPPLQPGLLRLYGMRFCPYVKRTSLVLNYLKVKYEVVNINLRQKPEWLFKRNPLGLVPVLELNDKVIYESNICNEFLDEVYGDNQLLTKDPYKRAQQKIMLEQFSQATSIHYGALRSLKHEDVLCQVEKLENKLKSFEEALSGKFFGGDVPGFLDFGMWPWFEQMPLYAKYKGVDVLRRKSQFPKLLAWMAEMESLPAVKACAMPLEHIAEFIVQNNNPLLTHPNFDIGLN